MVVLYGMRDTGEATYKIALARLPTSRNTRRRLASHRVLHPIAADLPMAALKDRRISGTHPYRHFTGEVSELLGWPAKEANILGDWTTSLADQEGAFKPEAPTRRVPRVLAKSGTRSRPPVPSRFAPVPAWFRPSPQGTRTSVSRTSPVVLDLLPDGALPVAGGKGSRLSAESYRSAATTFLTNTGGKSSDAVKGLRLFITDFARFVAHNARPLRKSRASQGTRDGRRRPRLAAADVAGEGPVRAR